MGDGSAPEDNPKIMPVAWWFGFARSFQDGRIFENGRIRHVLSEFEFEHHAPRSWYSDRPLSEWSGIDFCGYAAEDDDDVEILDLSGCGLKCIPTSIDRLVKLVYLSVCDNKLTCLPECIGQMKSLTQLDISGNQRCNLPESIGNLTKLIHLKVQRNELSCIPDSCRHLKALTWLDLSSNRFLSLPECISGLSSLTVLDAANNQLTYIPNFICNLTLMTILRVYGNRLATVPEVICQVPSLTHFFMSDNPITLTKQGRSSIMKRIGRESLYINMK